MSSDSEDDEARSTLLWNALQAVNKFLAKPDIRRSMLGDRLDHFVCVPWAGKGGSPSFSLRALLAKVRRLVREAIESYNAHNPEAGTGAFAALLRARRCQSRWAWIIVVQANIPRPAADATQKQLQAWVVRLAGGLLPTGDKTKRVCGFEDCTTIVTRAAKEKEKKSITEWKGEKKKAEKAEKKLMKLKKANRSAKASKAIEDPWASADKQWRKLNDDEKAEALLPAVPLPPDCRCNAHRIAGYTRITRGNVVPWIEEVATGPSLPGTMPYKCCRPLADREGKLWRDYLRSDMLADLKAAGGRRALRCHMCGTKFDRNKKKPIHIDHDHTCPDGPSVRGLLCPACNVRREPAARTMFEMTAPGKRAALLATNCYQRTYTGTYIEFVEHLRDWKAEDHLDPVDGSLTELHAYLVAYNASIADATWAV